MADATLSTAKRQLEREEADQRKHYRAATETRRIEDQLAVTDERSQWALELLLRQEREARDTMELLFRSKIVEVLRSERSRKQREKMDRDVEDYLLFFFWGGPGLHALLQQSRSPSRLHPQKRFNDHLDRKDTTQGWSSTQLSARCWNVPSHANHTHR
jgi:hypothetical protein